MKKQRPTGLSNCAIQVFVKCVENETLFHISFEVLDCLRYCSWLFGINATLNSIHHVILRAYYIKRISPIPALNFRKCTHSEWRQNHPINSRHYLVSRRLSCERIATQLIASSKTAVCILITHCPDSPWVAMILAYILLLLFWSWRRDDWFRKEQV